MENSGYQIIPLADGVWAIEMKMVRAFLVAGEISALLIDTGAGGVNLRAAVCECTKLPVRVVNTHAHFDHISGNGDFEIQFVHPKELGSLSKAGFQAHPVGDGSGFDLGGRMLQTVGLPGHSPGSLGLWDAEAGLLFAGDAVAKGRPVFLCLDGASLEAFIRSMKRIISMEQCEEGGCIRRIFCAHGEMEVGMETVRQLRECGKRVLRGELPGELLFGTFERYMPENARLCKYEDVSLLVT